MSSNEPPRVLTSVLVEETADDVIVTWGLGEVAAQRFDVFGYELAYFGLDGNGGKRLSVKVHASGEVTASVWDNESNTNANYGADAVTLRADAAVVRYRDASIGLEKEGIGVISAYRHIDGRDQETSVQVSLMRR
jgi:hypothetical protein